MNNARYASIEKIVTDKSIDDSKKPNLLLKIASKTRDRIERNAIINEAIRIKSNIDKNKSEIDRIKRETPALSSGDIQDIKLLFPEVDIIP